MGGYQAQQSQLICHPPDIIDDTSHIPSEDRPAVPFHRLFSKSDFHLEQRKNKVWFCVSITLSYH